MSPAVKSAAGQHAAIQSLVSAYGGMLEGLSREVSELHVKHLNEKQRADVAERTAETNASLFRAEKQRADKAEAELAAMKAEPDAERRPKGEKD